jgi:membrane protein YdbS with pleckstrin-like domain
MSPTQKLPSQVLTYWLVRDALAVLVLTAGITVALYYLGIDEESVQVVMARISLVVAGAVGIYLALAAYRVAYFSLFSFGVEANLVSVHSGVVVQSRKAVQYEESENADVVRGPLMMLFGLANLRVFTASPGQIHIVQTKNGSRTVHTPDIDLVLPIADASALAERFSKAVNRVVITPEV